MAISYSLLLTQGIQELLEISQALKTQGINLPRVRRLKYLAGFLGIQKLSDLGFWLEDWQEAGGDKVSPMDDETKNHFFSLIQAVLSEVESPEVFGEFVNSQGIVQRPLYKNEIPVHQLFNKLRLIHPIEFKKRNIFRLPLTTGEAFPYNLRLPARFLERADLDAFLALIYVDLGKSPKREWREYADIFQSLSSKGVILYQGAMDVSYDFIKSKKPLLPYYLLYSSEVSPQEFLARHGLSGYIMSVLKKPGEPWSSQGQPVGDETDEDFWDIYDLESDESPEEKPVELQIQPPIPTESLPLKTNAGLLSTALTWKNQVETPPPEEKKTPEDEPRVETLEAPPAYSPPIFTGEKLAEIPFTLDNLEDNNYIWPRGISDNDFLPPEKRPEKSEDYVPDLMIQDLPDDEKLSTTDSWVPEFKAPHYDEHLHNLRESEEFMAVKKQNPWPSLIFGFLSVLFLGSGIYLYTNYQETTDRGLYNLGTESAYLLSQILDKSLAHTLSSTNLFIPSTEGMNPADVNEDFFNLFYPSQSGVRGFGLLKGDLAPVVFGAYQLSDEVKIGIKTPGTIPRTPGESIFSLSDTNQSVWQLSKDDSESHLWFLDWSVILPQISQDAGLIIYSPNGEVLYKSGEFWKNWKDFTVPSASFQSGVLGGPVNYQDNQGRTVLGGFHKSAQGLLVAVIQPQVLVYKTILP